MNMNPEGWYVESENALNFLTIFTYVFWEKGVGEIYGK